MSGYTIRIKYTEGTMYHGAHGVRCDIYDRWTGEHLSYGWGGDRDEALYFAEDTLNRNIAMLYDSCVEPSGQPRTECFSDIDGRTIYSCEVLSA